MQQHSYSDPTASERGGSFVLAEIGLDTRDDGSRRFVMLVIDRDRRRLGDLARVMNDSEPDPWTLYRVLDYATACERARRAARVVA